MIEKQLFINKHISRAGIFLSFLVLFIVVYSAVIQTGYFYLDDYEYFTPPGGRSFDKFMDEALREGRMTEGVSLYMISANIESAESTKTIRFFGLIGIALFASVIYAIFRRSGFRYDHAYLMSLLICLLPSFQLIASWMIIVPSIYSATLAVLSALVIFNGAFKENEKGKAKNKGVFFTAIVLLILSLSINQPPAMMYWAMGLIFFLTRDNGDFSKKEYRQQVGIYFCIGLSSIVIYYLIYIKLIPSMMDSSITRDNVIPILGMQDRFIWFLNGPVMRTMNLWNPDPTNLFAVFTGVIIFAGSILSSLQDIKDKKQFSPINWVTKIILIISLLILSFLPKMMVREPSVTPNYWVRTLISLGPAFSFLFLWGIINIVNSLKYIPNFSTELRKGIITVMLAIITVVTAFSAYNNVNNFAVRFSEEIKFITETVKEYGVSNISGSTEIYLRTLKPKGFPADDRFNELKAPLHVSNTGWLVRVLIKQALHDAEVKKDIQIANKQITLGAHDAPVPENSDVLVIDMRKLNISSIKTIYEKQ